MQVPSVCPTPVVRRARRPVAPLEQARAEPATGAGAAAPVLPVVPPHARTPVAALLAALPSVHSLGLPLGGPPTAVVPHAILPDGRAIPPDSYMGGYHGTARIPPDVALRDGLPARGDDWHLLEHSEQRSASAFRGTTDSPTDPTGEYGAAYWAGEGGWVYEIRDVPTWDVNSALEGRVQTPDGHYRGNLMRGEAERAIPARVTPEHIRRWGRVESTSTGHLYVKKWVVNPASSQDPR